MILAISDQEFQKMRMVVMDDDKDEALRMINYEYHTWIMPHISDWVEAGKIYILWSEF